MTVFYLGPVGTFTHDAARTYFAAAAPEDFKPCDSPSEVVRKLVSEPDASGVVPIENSIHG